MDEWESEFNKLVQGLRCDRCNGWPASFHVGCDAIVCDQCVAVKLVLRALLHRSFANAELVVEDHDDI